MASSRLATTHSILHISLFIPGMDRAKGYGRPKTVRVKLAPSSL